MTNSKDKFNTIDAIFHPRSIAIIGASENSGSFGSHFLRFLDEAGYKGKIYAVNPLHSKVFGLISYPSLGDIPGSVDYVISSVPAKMVPDMIDQCPAKKVKAVHLFTGRLSETGNPEAIKLEELILAKVKKAQIRLVGPNCMGIYNPGHGLSCNYDFPKESGNVACIIQSGGVCGEFVRYASLKGIRFSKVISYGNGIDLNECDYIEYLSQDPETKVIVLYIEGTRDGKRLVNILKKATDKKPVIVLKGGRGKSGSKAAESHTASMAGSHDIWKSVLKQTNAVAASGVDEMIDLTLAFSMLPEIYDNRAIIFGGGGGKSVLSADEAEEGGLVVNPLPEEVNKIVHEKEPTLSGWLGNPVDASVFFSRNLVASDVLRLLAVHKDVDLIIANTTEDGPLDENSWVNLISREIECYLEIGEKKLKPIMVIMKTPHLERNQLDNWRWKTYLKYQKKLLAAQIPFFSTVFKAAKIINKLTLYYKRKNKR